MDFCLFLRFRLGGDSNLQSVVFVLQLFDAEPLSLDLLSQQRRVDHLEAGTRTQAGRRVGWGSKQIHTPSPPPHTDAPLIIHWGGGGVT